VRGQEAAAVRISAGWFTRSDSVDLVDTAGEQSSPHSADPGPAQSGGDVLAPDPWESPPSRRGWIFSAIWLFYLIPTLGSAWEIHSPVRRAGSIVIVVLFAVIYMRTFYVVRDKRWSGESLPLRVQIAAMAAVLGLTVLGCVLIGQAGTAFCVYLSVTSVLVLPFRLALAAVLANMIACEIAFVTVPGWKPEHGLTFSVFVSALAIWGVVQMITRNQQLARARAQNAQLAVLEERNRFARDIHDLLGHSLTVVTVKAELAGRLISIDPERAAKEIADVERLARDALADVRATVAGYREVSLAGELISARAALDAAGICAELPGALDDVPGDRRELFGWAVREGVTNVIRHSGASRCRISVSSSAIEILDDGRGPGALAGPVGEVDGRVGLSGNGLLGLHERAAAAGSTVLVGRASDQGGFRLRVGW
jgi:two-component system sensor histidine kinase DesK